ncbi:MAG TPA: hypothetical protein VIO11_02315, partial [Candidatus Methanoperedens sp.]
DGDSSLERVKVNSTITQIRFRENARRKPNTGNRSVWFDEEAMASAIALLCARDRRSHAPERR